MQVKETHEQRPGAASSSMLMCSRWPAWLLAGETGGKAGPAGLPQPERSWYLMITVKESLVGVGENE